MSGGEVFGLVSTECLSADKDPSSPHRDSGVRFQPVPEGRITAPVMGSFTAGAAPGFLRGRGIGWDRAKPPHGVQTPTEHPTAVGPQEAPTAAQGRTSRVHRPQGGGGRTPRDHRRSGRDSTELRPQTWVFGPGGGRGGGAWKSDALRRVRGVGRQNRFAGQRRSPHRMRRPHARKKGTAKKLRACDNAAHQQYRKAGL